MTADGHEAKLYIGIDIGGTFTDFVTYDSLSGRLLSHKVLSTPDAPEIAVIKGITELLTELDSNLSAVQAVFHGSTVATNALLERKGARTALVTTEGFRDVLEIARQSRPELYNFDTPQRNPIIPASGRLEVRERVDKNGNVLIPLQSDFDWLIAAIEEQKIEALAISLLFSFVNPQHERILRQSLARDDLVVCLSSDILPEFREYERTSTTVINAYVTPVLKRYLSGLEEYLSGTRFYVMQSNGGSISAGEASQEGVRCILSGPAGGVAAASFFQRQINSPLAHPIHGLISFDMGGTSTDVTLIKNEPTLTRESQIDGYPIALPMLDIHTIGSGGGSIAAVDSGGALVVGPQSAGADPGPACYGKGDLPTVTDANLVLGRIRPDHFLGGAMPLFPQRAHLAVNNLARELDLPVQVCAAGIVDIANTHMAKALRVISVERGEDPADFAMVSFGGAGGLHAVELARLVGIPRVYVPRTAAVFSAFGMLVADTVKNYSRTIMASAELGYESLRQAFTPLRLQAENDLLQEGILRNDISIKPKLDMRYQGQSYEISVPLATDYINRFHQAHKQAYGYSLEEHPIEIVNLRVDASGRKPEQIDQLPEVSASGSFDQAFLGDYPVVVNKSDLGQSGDRAEIPVPFYLADLLPSRTPFEGPAVIIRPDTTIFIPQPDTVQVDEHRNIIISLEL